MMTKEYAASLANKLLHEPSLISQTPYAEIDEAMAVLGTPENTAWRMLGHVRKLKEEGKSAWDKLDLKQFPD